MLRLCIFVFTLSQKQISAEEIALISYVIFFTLALIVVFVVFFLTFQKRKNQFLLEKIEQQRRFDEELLKSQQEIQEETLKHVGRELHDNVGQLLSYATMQLNSLVNDSTEALKPKAIEAASALKSGLTEVRALSKSLNSDVIFNQGFEVSLKNEIDRLNKLGELQATLTVTGDKIEFSNKKDEVFLIRILQEFCTNTLKYGEAETLNFTVDYSPNCLKISVKDNGKGFDMDHIQPGSGLINMKKRAEMIEADYHLTSVEGEGTTLYLNYNFRT